METTRWQASHNPFRAAMEESVENALGIATYTCNMLFANKDNSDAGFGILYSETDALHNALLDALGIKGSRESSKTATTEQLDLLFQNMKEKLDHFDDLIRPVFGKNTLEYKTLWGNNRNRFYRGSFEQRESALKGFATAMQAYSDLTDVADEVIHYYKSLHLALEAQQVLKGDFKSDSIEVRNAIEALIIQQDRILGWLKFYYASHADAQLKVSAFFDISKIINHGNNKNYSIHIPIGGFVKVCRHTFKPTDKVKITIDGTEDVWIGLTADGKAPANQSNAFHAVAGTTIEKPASEIFPDFTHRVVTASNSSLTSPSHLVFEIVEA